MTAMKYAYFPGCSALEEEKELDVSARLTAEALGIELVDVPQFSCCGAGLIHEEDPHLEDLVNARNFSYAEALGLPILTLCNTCLLTMRSALEGMRRNPRRLESVNDDLSRIGREFRGEVEVTHWLWAVAGELGIERLRALVKRPLAGLRVAPFYGCHILRPDELLGFENGAHPRSMEDVLDAVGAIPVDYRERLSCCGFHIDLVEEDVALEMSARVLVSAREAGAEIMVTPCPLCHINLDLYQSRALRAHGDDFELPVVHLPQLVGLALGLDPAALKLKRNIVAPQPALRRIGLA